MKKYLLSLTVFFTTMVASAQISFTVGTNSVPVEFEDTTLSLTNRVLICSDLTRIFSFENTFTNLIEYWREPKGEEIAYFKEKSRFYPSKFWNKTEVRMIQNTHGLYVEKTLSDVYLNTFSEFLPQSNELHQADAFIAMLNAGGATQLTLAEKKQLLWLHPDVKPQEGTPEDYNNVAESTRELHYFLPSILQAHWFEVGPNDKNFYTVIIATTTNSPPKLLDIPLLYDGVRWRFLFM